MKVAVAVFLIAMLNGTAWSLLTPAFQVPDETAHFAYAQRLAETGVRAGDVGRSEYSTEQEEVMAAIGTLSIIGRPLSRAAPNENISASIDEALERAEELARRNDGGGPSTASSQPPLFYALSSIPYRALSWASLSVRLHAMRALSVAIFALGAAFCALFVYELVPRRPDTALLGGLAVALSPYTTFIASGVTPDTLLLAVSSGLLWILARASRQRLTAVRAVALGLLIGAGLMTKLTFLAFLVPGCVAVFILAIRDRQYSRARGGMMRSMALFTVAICILPALFLTWLSLTGRALRPASTSSPSAITVGEIKAFNWRELASYGWQLFLPRLPFMNDAFEYAPLREIWIEGYAGRYGWLDYSAPEWINTVVLRVAQTGAILVAAAAITARRALRARWLELVVAIGFLAALGAVIAKAGYDYRRTTGLTFEQPRYLFPIMAFYALGLALACSSLGRRASPYLGTAVVALFLLHNISGMALTIERYYT